MQGGLPSSVGILEDNRDFSAWLERMLGADPAYNILFNVALVAEARRRLEQGPVPALMLVDMQLPDGSGLEIVAAARAAPDTRVLVLTVLADRSSVIGALELGAHGYLLKDSPADQIKTAIRAVLDGGSPISSQAASHLVAAIRRPDASQCSARPTARESEIVQLIAKGLTSAEIAAVIGISVHTVGDHIKAIYRKLAVGSRSEAVFEARAQGWLSMIE